MMICMCVFFVFFAESKFKSAKSTRNELRKNFAKGEMEPIFGVFSTLIAS